MLLSSQPPRLTRQDKTFRSSSRNVNPKDAVFFLQRPPQMTKTFSSLVRWHNSTTPIILSHLLQIKVELWFSLVLSSTESQYIVARKLVNIQINKKRFRFPTCQFGALARAFLWCIRIMVKFTHIPVGGHGGTLVVSYVYIYIYDIICFVV